MVRSGVLFLGALGGGGWGTSASSPFGVTGEITMKMISSTSITSTIGVTLMSELILEPSSRFEIPITDISRTSNRERRNPRQVGKARRRRTPAPDKQLMTDTPSRLPAGVLSAN